MKFPVLLCLLATPAFCAQQTAAPAGVDALSPAAVQKAIDALEKSGFATPDEKSRALLQGLLERMAPKVMLTGTETGAAAIPFYSELCQNHTGYLRPGAFTAENVRKCEDALKAWSKQGIGAVVLDLRASPHEDNMDAAADLAELFVPRGSYLFDAYPLSGVHPARPSPPATQKPPVFQGVLVVLVDKETAETAEAVAAVLQRHARALIVGDAPAGSADEFGDVPLENGVSLHMAVSHLEFEEGDPINGLKPDIAEGLGPVDKSNIMQEITARGIASVVSEQSRAHLNEAALAAGRDPGIDAAEAEQHGKPATHLIDRQLQRALDAVTSISIFQVRASGTAP